MHSRLHYPTDSNATTSDSTSNTTTSNTTTFHCMQRLSKHCLDVYRYAELTPVSQPLFFYYYFFFFFWGGGVNLGRTPVLWMPPITFTSLSVALCYPICADVRYNDDVIAFFRRPGSLDRWMVGTLSTYIECSCTHYTDGVLRPSQYGISHTDDS